MTDVNLAEVNRRENRLTKGLAVAVACVLLLVVSVVGVIGLVLDQNAKIDEQNDLLNARTPVIARIDDSERRSSCAASIELRFMAAIVQTLATPLDQRDQTVNLLLGIAKTVDHDIRAGTDPCSIDLPVIP